MSSHDAHVPHNLGRWFPVFHMILARCLIWVNSVQLIAVSTAIQLFANGLTKAIQSTYFIELVHIYNNTQKKTQFRFVLSNNNHFQMQLIIQTTSATFFFFFGGHFQQWRVISLLPMDVRYCLLSVVFLHVERRLLCNAWFLLLSRNVNSFERKRKIIQRIFWKKNVVRHISVVKHASK